MSIALYFGFVLLAFCGWALFVWLRKYKINKLFEKPLKSEWLQFLKANVSFYPHLSAELQDLLHGHISYFLHSKEFVGCNDQEINDEVRLTIAANACLLVLKRGRPSYPSFQSVLVYPDTYVANQPSTDGMIVNDDESVRAGESWFRGPLVLSWSDVQRGVSNTEDGHNVVLHEFAHKLDEENGIMDGLPILQDRAHYAEWSSVLNQEFDEFLHRVGRRKNKVIDSYGAVSPVEFFAVITESFFEKPTQMKKRLPDLYDQLSRYYQLDPSEWH